MTDGIVVRPFTPDDINAVWHLMRALAVFEGYIAVTPEDFLASGFGPAPPFGVFVAVRGGAVAGIAVHYRQSGACDAAWEHWTLPFPARI